MKNPHFFMLVDIGQSTGGTLCRFFILCRCGNPPGRRGLGESRKTKGGVQLAENNEKTTKRKGNNGNGFKKGQSGNPGGRPKRTDEEIGVLEEIKKLAANVPKVLQTILEDKASSPAYRLKAVEIILDRTCGKADAHVSIDAEIKPKGDFVIEIGEESENESDN